MANKQHTRKKGIRLNRLPNYSESIDEEASTHPGALKFKAEMVRFVAEKAQLRINGKKSSHRTVEVAVDVLGESSLRLWRLGYRLTNLNNINGKHIEAIVRNQWACGASPKYLASLMTQLNKLDDWLKKPGLVRSAQHYLPEVNVAELKVCTIAKKSKSWSENGINIDQKIRLADELDLRFGLMLRMCFAFGLRRNEVLQIRPHLDDREYFLDVRPGIAKGGRPRVIYIENSIQREVLDLVKSNVKKLDYLGWSDTSSATSGLLKRNVRRYARMMIQIGITRIDAGVTGHGLRAEFAENSSVRFGITPATRGGVKGQMDKEDSELVKLKMSESLGHSRARIASGYYGSLSKKIQNSIGERVGGIEINEDLIASIYLNPPPKVKSDGSYPVLTKRETEEIDITVIAEEFIDGVSIEKFRSMFEDFANEEDCKHGLDRVAVIDFYLKGKFLLRKFGVLL